MMTNIKGMKPTFIADKLPEPKTPNVNSSILPLNNFKSAHRAVVHDDKDNDNGNENCRVKLNYV